MDKKVLKAEVRKLVGRKVKNLRKEGLLPANVSGKKVESVSVQVNFKEFKEIYDEVGETGLIMLKLESEERPVLVHNVQMHALTDDMIHVDFLQVDLKEKVEAQVPVEVVGTSPAEKQSLGTVVQHLNEVTVEALPTDLPEKFEVSVDELTEVDQAIFVKDIKVDRSKVEIKTNEEEIVVKVEPPQKEEVVEAPIAAEGETPAEGAVPAEGEGQSETPAGEEPKE
jgi:large subunit ribosomal protein L25